MHSTSRFGSRKIRVSSCRQLSGFYWRHSQFSSRLNVANARRSVSRVQPRGFISCSSCSDDKALPTITCSLCARCAALWQHWKLNRRGAKTQRVFERRSTQSPILFLSASSRFCGSISYFSLRNRVLDLLNACDDEAFFFAKNHWRVG